ncbi:MAG: LysR family transcriptional regulator [Pseudomonadota bacterium]
MGLIGNFDTSNLIVMCGAAPIARLASPGIVARTGVMIPVRLTLRQSTDNLTSMDLIQLEIFCGVFRERSFSRAAETLGLTQPTVSTRIKEFEEELGTALFSRLGREIEPTEAGRFLYDQAVSLLAQRRRLEEGMTSFLNRVEGPLVVGTGSAAAECLLPGILMSFQESHPSVSVELRFFGDGVKALDELRSEGMDLAVLPPVEGRDDVVSEPFCGDELVLITPPGGQWKDRPTIHLAELKGLPLITLLAGSATRASLEQALAKNRTRLADFKVVAQFGRTTAIKDVVAQGYGVAFVSRRAVATEVEAGSLRIASVPELGKIMLSFNIVYQRRRELSPTARAFLEHLRQAVASVD